MGRARQPVRRLRCHRGHGPRDRGRRGPRAAESRRTHDRPERAGHSAPCRQPAIVGPEREPRGAGTGPARGAERGRPQRAHQEAEGAAGADAAEAHRDHPARRRQVRRRRPQRNHEEHQRGGAEPCQGRPRTARHRRPSRQAVRRAAQCAGRLRRRGQSRDARRADPGQRHPRLGRPVRLGCLGRRADRRPARQRRRQRQSRRRRHERGAVGEHERQARRHPEGVQDGPGPLAIQPRSVAGQSGQQDAARDGGEAARARHRQDRRVQPA